MDTKLRFVLADILCLQYLVGCFSSKLLSQTACLLNEDSRLNHQQSDIEVECNWLYHKRIGQIMSAYLFILLTGRALVWKTWKCDGI